MGRARAGCPLIKPPVREVMGWGTEGMRKRKKVGRSIVTCLLPPHLKGRSPENLSKD